MADGADKARGSGGFSAWASRPFREDMDAVSWGLFLVFAVSVAFLWTRVLSNITEIGD